MKRKAIIFFILILVILFLPKVSQASSVDLVISEIMYDDQGSDSGQEWIEVYNSGGENVEVLTGSGSQTWRFWDGSNHLLNLVNGTSTINSLEYFIIAADANQFLANHPGFSNPVFDTVMSLNNSSGTVALSFDGGNSQSISASYEAIWGASGDGNTLEKIVLNQDSSQSNWQVSYVLGGTPGQINSQASNNDNPPSDDTPPDDGGGSDVPPDPIIPSNDFSQIKISEFLPNPKGSDESEWIELYNAGNLSVDLGGCKLQDNSARIFTLTEETSFNINPSSYLLLPRSLTGISLNNTGGDSVKFYDPNNNLIESISYLDTAPENKSYARINNDFVWTGGLTPGAANIIEVNLAPQAKISILSQELLVGKKIIFSAEASIDPEEGRLSYFWDFGDDMTADEKKENHIYESPGSYLVRLKVTDPGGLFHEVSSLLNILEATTTITLQDIKPIDFQPADLIISEFLPDPQGSDEEEWVELYNASNKNINLAAWQLDDDEGGSKPYIFNASSTILAGDFLLIKRSESKLTLNNQNDAVRLLTPLGEAWQKVAYEKIKAGQSQAWDLINQEWFWTENPSPLAPNYQAENNLGLALVKENWQDKQLVSVSGLALNPNSTSSRSLFIAPLNFDSSVDYENIIEVYNSKKDWPPVEVGEVIQISGQIDNKYQPLRIKIKSKADLQKIDQKLAIATPDIIELGDLADADIGSYLSLHAWLVKKSGTNLYLAEEKEGESKLRASLNFSTKDLNLKKDTEIIATGVLGKMDDQYKLFVLRPQDLSLSQTVLAEKISNDLSTSTNLVTNSLARAITVKKFLFYLILIVILVLGVIFIRDKKRV